MNGHSDIVILCHIIVYTQQKGVLIQHHKLFDGLNQPLKVKLMMRPVQRGAVSVGGRSLLKGPSPGGQLIRFAVQFRYRMTCSRCC